MRKFLAQNPALKIALVFLLFFCIVIACSMFFGYQTVGGYLAPCLLLFITWLLYRSEGKNLSELGLTFTKWNLSFLPLGLIIGIMVYGVGMLAAVFYQGLEISVNEHADYGIIAAGFLFFIQGVMNEELIFRGYSFKLTVDKYGVVTANVIFAILFLIWHWISWNAFGNYGLMLSAITVCFGHLLFSTSLLRSGTLFLPIGIHLGNNWAVKHLAAYQSTDETLENCLFIVTGSSEHDSQFVLTAISIIWMLVVTGVIHKWINKR